MWAGNYRSDLASMVSMATLSLQVYSSMERLSLHEEKRTPPPTKRSLSEEGGDRVDSLSGLKTRDRSWLVGSPEM